MPNKAIPTNETKKSSPVELLALIFKRPLPFLFMLLICVYIFGVGVLSYYNAVLILSLLLLVSFLVEIQYVYKWDYDAMLILASLAGIGYYYNYYPEFKYFIANILFLIIQVCRIIWRVKH